MPLLVVLFGYSLGSQTLPAWVPEQSNAAYTVAGLAGALLLLASLLAHEAAHAITALKKGIPVENITLWALGGMTEMGKPRAAGAAFLVAVSGPLTSLVLGAAALGAGLGLNALTGWAVPAAVMVWLGWVNFVLGVFNLLPAAPLDGGRVVQALVWWRTGDQARAERAAARGGQVFGLLLIAAGWISVLRGAFGGLWLMVIGFFIMIVANAERRHAGLAAALHGVRAGDAMSSPVETCPDWLTVERCIDEVAMQARHSTLPLIDFEGRPSGMVHLPQLANTPTPQRETWRVRDVATPLSQYTTCAPDDFLEDVLEKVHRSSGMRILVTDGQHLMGIITARPPPDRARSRLRDQHHEKDISDPQAAGLALSGGPHHRHQHQEGDRAPQENLQDRGARDEDRVPVRHAPR
ncbi:hypothetical protein AR457_34040 [Streptomyces agglomeratus]|uniref:site-2 protease family protein n=1 Tax=Streptomyces agglomeratus TaxID=285458 RepID=UPI000852755A|nr:site-2 protease family protein [Streptomyces agglomeratus]OEJ37054.1 hypothetical protein BGK70_01540 [Streptomyces agglomeratus]OEJ48407.1 hypothetical protein AR457_34040 [Streptomyces agglomeratus]OEJ56905.1 hypothetical protein BGM19_01535 [Streptomyces agglomeratus]